MRIRDRVHDRQTEADSAARPRACVICAGESIEDSVECLGWNAAPAVDDLDHEIPAQPQRAKLDRLVLLRVLHRILEQCVERCAQRLLVGLDVTVSDMRRRA